MARQYAITVRREGGKFLFLRIVRAPQGDIYVPFPIPGPKEWSPHLSLHRDGQCHYKDFDRRSLARRLITPDEEFRGTENLVNIAREKDHWQNASEPFVPSCFSDYFQIDVLKLPCNSQWTQLSIDIVEPGQKPRLVGELIDQKFFRHEIPWIAVSLVST